MERSNKRVFGLDLTRFIAILFVIVVHSFLHDGYYNTSIRGVSMFLLTFIRNTSFLCVPLFILLTGYLKSKEEPTKEYYKKIKPVVVSYLVISVIVIIYKLLSGKDKEIVKLLFGITTFETIDYAWYFEMYIGLFLLTPFLNILYKNIPNKKTKQLLIITLILVTSVGPTLNGLKIENYSISIMPNYWAQMYPITYYYIGSYINEYKVDINKKLTLILLLTVLFFQTILMFYGAYGFKFTDKIASNYNNFFTIIEATLLFIMIYNLERKPNIIRNIISRVSKVSFNMYLISLIFDFTIYDCLRKMFKGSTSLFIIPSISIPSVFILSFITALILDYIIKFILKKTDFTSNKNMIK